MSLLGKESSHEVVYEMFSENQDVNVFASSKPTNLVTPPSIKICDKKAFLPQTMLVAPDKIKCTSGDIFMYFPC